MNYEEVKVGTYYHMEKYSYGSDDVITVKCIGKKDGKVLVRKSLMGDITSVSSNRSYVSPSKLIEKDTTCIGELYKKIRIFYFAITMIFTLLFMCGVLSAISGTLIISFLITEWFFTQFDKGPQSAS